MKTNLEINGIFEGYKIFNQAFEDLECGNVDLCVIDAFPNDDAEEIRTYTGYAYCAPEDEWDETYGKHLAEYRASKLRQSDVNHEIKKFIKGISKCIDNLYDYGLLKDPHFPDK